MSAFHYVCKEGYVGLAGKLLAVACFKRAFCNRHYAVFEGVTVDYGTVVFKRTTYDFKRLTCGKLASNHIAVIKCYACNVVGKFGLNYTKVKVLRGRSSDGEVLGSAESRS